jgi:hypothetical protein
MSSNTCARRAACAFATLFALAACEVTGTLVPPPEASADPPDGSPSDDGDASVFACVTAPTSCPDSPPHWADVEPIFESRCGGCHSPAGDGPWPLTSYQDIVDWQDIVRGDLLKCSMPPVDAGVTLTSDERMELLVWIRCALPP